MALYKGTTKLDGGGGGGATYTAGLNIQISPNNVISATDTTYTAGRGIDITNNGINARVGTGLAIGSCQDYSAMRGPAPEGYHVPSIGEFRQIRDILDDLGIDSSALNSVKTYLKLPQAGVLVEYGVYFRGGDDGFNYRTCTATINSNVQYADKLGYHNSTVNYDGNSGRGTCYPIRAFKDNPVVPNAQWTILYNGGAIATGAGIFHSSTLGLISLSSDGQNRLTIADKNLGATVVYNSGDALTNDNCGGYFQWGNNHMFPGARPESIISTPIDASGYGPGNYYSSSDYYYVNGSDNDWDSSHNKNLWGGVTGVVTQTNTILNAGVLSVNGQTGDVIISTAEESNTKTFYLSSTSDLTNAQAAYEWYLAGKNPILSLDDNTSQKNRVYIIDYYQANVGTEQILHFRSAKSTIRDQDLYGVSEVDNIGIQFVCNNGQVTNIYSFAGSGEAGFLNTQYNYPTPYVPQYPGSPATKKYVDDNTNTKTFYLSSTSDLTTAQAVVDWIIAGKTAFILFNGAVYKQRDRNTSGGNERFFFSTDDNSTVQNTNLGNTVIKHLELQINSDETTHIVSTISASEKYLGKYINIDGSYSDAFIPTQDYHPATKKYVDDGDTKIASTAPSNPIEGMLWYDTTNNILKSYDGANWNEVGGETYTAGEGISIGNISDYSAMRGPAPDGFHIPQKTEREAICNILTVTFGLASNGNMLGTYLYMPRPGNRYYTTSDVNGPGTEGYYWCCTAYDGGSAYVLNFNSASITYPQNGFARSYGYSLRCFKDVPVIPTASWSILYDGSSVATGAGVFRNSTSGLISVSGDGQNWITIMDKNLGATSTDVTSTDSYGYYYQWGNNYGFPTTGTVTTSSTQVDTTGYGPGNYYSDNIFIIGSRNRSSTQNNNLWGGVTGVVTLTNAITNTGVLSVNGQTGDVTIVGGIQNDTTGTTTTVTKIWAGTEAEYALITPAADTIYYVM